MYVRKRKEKLQWTISNWICMKRTTLRMTTTRIGTIITKRTEFTHSITIVIILNKEGLLTFKAHARYKDFPHVDIHIGKCFLN